MTTVETIEVLKAMRGLPAEKIAELRDFALFLQDRYANYSDEWTEEDMEEFATASLRYFEESVEGEAGS